MGGKARATAAWDVGAVMERLRAMGDPELVKGMERFGVDGGRALGIRVPPLRALSKEIGRDHALALGLWATGVHEARILTPMVAEVGRTTEAQADAWVVDIDAWDICDGLCFELLRYAPFAHSKALEWAGREEEYVKRAGFALMAGLAIKDKGAPDAAFLPFLEAVEREADDDRNFVRKAVNWALRQIGKRDAALNRRALEVARQLKARDSRAARWVGSDAARELASEAVQRRLRERKSRSVKGGAAKRRRARRA